MDFDAASRLFHKRTGDAALIPMVSNLRRFFGKWPSFGRQGFIFLTRGFTGKGVACDRMRRLPCRKRASCRSAFSRFSGCRIFFFPSSIPAAAPFFSWAKKRAAVFCAKIAALWVCIQLWGWWSAQQMGITPKQPKITTLSHLQFFLVLRKQFLEWNTWSYLQHSIHIFPDCKIVPTLYLPIRYLFFGLTLRVQQLVLRFLPYLPLK